MTEKLHNRLAGEMKVLLIDIYFSTMQHFAIKSYDVTEYLYL